MSNCKDSSLKKAVFLDRDGTVNIEKEYLHTIDEFEFTERAPEAIRMLNQAGYLVVVVSNQSGIARGYYNQEAVLTLHRAVDRLLADSGARVDAWYFCPHHPDVPLDGGECDCRKPSPGMLISAAADLGIDCHASWMIGDKEIDVRAGQAAGCRTILVTTGYGVHEQHGVDSAVPRCRDLYAAAKLICGGETD
ncbi:MAG: D-glycero-beta-D-manno-heptose 1,7-bisphosphate 7-phosphatase [Trichlorobacter sp.]